MRVRLRRFACYVTVYKTTCYRVELSPLDSFHFKLTQVGLNRLFFVVVGVKCVFSGENDVETYTSCTNNRPISIA